MLVNYRLHSHRTVATADLHLPYLILPKNIPLGDAVEQRIGNLTSSAGHQNTDWFSLEEKHGNYKIQRFLHICDLRLNEKGENRKSSSVIRLIKMWGLSELVGVTFYFGRNKISPAHLQLGGWSIYFYTNFWNYELRKETLKTTGENSVTQWRLNFSASHLLATFKKGKQSNHESCSSDWTKQTTMTSHYKWMESSIKSVMSLSLKTLGDANISRITACLQH